MKELYVLDRAPAAAVGLDLPRVLPHHQRRRRLAVHQVEHGGSSYSPPASRAPRYHRLPSPGATLMVAPMLSCDLGI